jgi:DnaJ-related protein SCJ1
LEVTLEELYNGVELDVFQKKQILCPKCRGTGAKNADDVTTCPDCKGSGTKVYTQQFGPGFYTQTQRTCDKCNGKGKVVKSTCPFCGGKKTSVNHDQHAHDHDLFHDEDEPLKVVVERGMKDGDNIKFDRAADQHADIAAGDVVFKVVAAPHRRFSRNPSNPDNLHMKMNITLLEALVGFERKFKHLDGHEVHMQRQEITSPGIIFFILTRSVGHIMTVAKEGMPVHGDSSEFGNLYIELSVVMPKQLSEDQKNSKTELHLV